jgi:hypothetical protein
MTRVVAIARRSLAALPAALVRSTSSARRSSTCRSTSSLARAGNSQSSAATSTTGLSAWVTRVWRRTSTRSTSGPVSVCRNAARCAGVAELVNSDSQVPSAALSAAERSRSLGPNSLAVSVPYT